MAALLSTGFIFIDIILVFGSAILSVYIYYKHSYQYWKNKGVPYLEPQFPYGNSIDLLSKSSTYGGEVKIWYDKLKSKGHKFGGAWSFSRKVLVLVDPDYIKDILSQDFQYFTDRDFYDNEKKDPLGTHLFNIKNPGWKPLRQKLTPTFTSGKMKIMFNSVLTCSDYMINYMEKCAKMGDDIKLREVLASFTTDVIGSAAFGIECNSFVDTDGEFRKQGIDMFNPTLTVYIKTFFTKNFPDLARKLGIKVGKSKPRQFFCDTVRQTIEYRNKHNIYRPDFLQLLIDINNESKVGEKPFKFEQIVANVVLFFIAGFDTSSTAMNFALYELARNQDLQNKVRDEINKVLKKHNWEVTYEALHDMTYLNQVLDESMRLYPPLLVLARICTKDYQLRDTDIIIEKGTSVVISPYALGRDPEYFPNPERFDPDRFSAEEKAKRHSFIHIPFGEGPRNCIGLRFGLMQAKIGLIRILTNFNLKISPKTEMPLTICNKHFLLKENETLYVHAEKI